MKMQLREVAERLSPLPEIGVEHATSGTSRDEGFPCMYTNFHPGHNRIESVPIGRRRNSIIRSPPTKNPPPSPPKLLLLFLGSYRPS